MADTKKAKTKKVYYSIVNIMKLFAEYNILLGQRANGKSYQVKNEVALKDAWDYINGRLSTTRLCEKGKSRKTGKFTYLRRWATDVKAGAVEEYFADSKKAIKEITEGMYDGIRAYGGVLYFVGSDADGNRVQSADIGRYHSLATAEHIKSLAFVDFTNIIFEEWITDGIYLVDEPTKLQQYVSTIFRLERGQVFLIGNTLSRVCPYFSEWCLEGVLRQKQGTIEMYHFHTSDDDEEKQIDIAVEYCAETKNDNKMFFGQAAKQIVSGEWDVKNVPKLPRDQSEYEKVYEVMFAYQSFKFVLELLIEPKDGGRVCFVYPLTKSHKKITRIITDEFSDSPYKTPCLDSRRLPEAYIEECFRLNKVCYSDNLTGSDFKQVLAQLNMQGLN